ncbi:adenosine 5'-monophosphoramidase HINT3 [Triplophysa rosa]|uniref:Histidine triad nucleotide-binding protein 3 n=1 Tax=Triplophysa rosa TaxID=992332 RepID=A0A9W7TLU9_TRIRA|nr:adenosine 5'-monophosphoramidase HINT3 [Triplophysa rosa]KAI7799677.1 histidine triad nucleotide-binding protein 3 [Triplophysa rosa]
MTEAKHSSENPNISADDDSYDDTCVFCMIANGDCPHTNILFIDEDIVCFQDIYPGAAHHYLVVPKKHIRSCKSLEADDISLVKKMAAVGRSMLKSNNVTDLEDISLGFHVPPYISVPHLHLHVLAPYSQLNVETEYKFTDFRYLTVEALLQALEMKKEGRKLKWINCLPMCI